MLKRLLFIFVLFFSFISVTYSYTNISACGTISVAGEYRLNTSILNSATSNCINIQTENVTLDCQGNTIDGNDVASNGIYIYRSSAEVTNITIKNCQLTDWGGSSSSKGAIYMYRSDLNNITNINISSGTSSGIYSYDSDRGHFENININGARNGIYFSGGMNNNIINIISINNSVNGISAYGMTYSNFSYINATSNSVYGFEFYGSYFRIENSSFINNYGDLIPFTSCSSTNIFQNLTGTLDKGIYVFKNSVNISNWNNNFSSIILCDADNSIINNVFSNHLNDKGVPLVINADFVNVSNINIINAGLGILSVSSGSTYNRYKNINISNSVDGFKMANWYSNYENLNSSNNDNIGFHFMGRYSNISNSNFNYNSNQGILVSSTSLNTNFFNNNITNNLLRGVSVIQGSNFLFFNNSILNNNQNVYTALSSINITFYGNNFSGGSYTLIDTDTYFNYSIAGIGNIGNYWSGFNCISSISLGDYFVCDNPNNYTVKTNVYDYAPLVSSLIIPSSPDYISPTPIDNSEIIANSITFKYENGTDSDNANITINTIEYSMTNEGSGIWSYTINPLPNQITQYTFQVYYNGGELETRTFTFYPKFDKSTVPSMSEYSVLIALIIIILSIFIFSSDKIRIKKKNKEIKNNNTKNNMNINNKNNSKNKIKLKNKQNKKTTRKSIAPVVATVLLLFVTVSAFIVLKTWFLSAQSDMYNKNLQNSDLITNNIQIYGIKNESTYNLYTKNSFYGYKEITKIQLNNQDCTMLATNVLVGGKISKIELNCPNIKNINDLKLFTNQEIVERTIRIVE